MAQPKPIALVTGATSGIGLEFARQLAAGGHDLVIVARDTARLERVADELNSTYAAHAETLPADLAQRTQLQRVADRLADPDRPVDVLVNNAGFALKGQFLQNDVADEERHLDVLVLAVLVLSHAAARAMSTRGRGRIVNVSSVAGFLTSGTYSAAKAWVTTFTEGLATELAGTGVTATALCPGFTHTEFHQRSGIRRDSTPGFMWLEARRVVADALADVEKGRVLSVPGPQYKAVVGLLRVMPRSLVRSRARTLRRSGSGGESSGSGGH
ncbi:MAG: SDR family NAD(P)-dependent oxidoreductase [Intrasporangium sp.]|uniref:SDR family NAD(P)-dependent oxidoreductase n=1 Tax=Intrasporangium sp. TaxID=1925024 RepID=UPI0026493183|nr:SDR family NAD(P)-dependent oxidoreductase [Intrasporangium sp.]MDN5797086.1 SDR family NAD(P)-dependent oxidoreductase [Intrasporangium sp.]